ncbi:hypothetical protein JXA85_01765 [Candidatus Woesearchaeota archaeon]|nr:hypothetical protein [Candidatus Woesearchaeota archaeon]
MTNAIYGVDADAEVTATQARDAMIECFYQAHRQLIENSVDVEEKQEYSKSTIKHMIQECFEEVQGDYNNPTVADLMAVCNKLAKFAKRFRGKDIVEKHYREIMSLIKKVKE